MENRVADTTVIITIEKYEELIENRAKYYSLLSECHELKAKLNKRAKPFFGGTEVENEANT